MSEKSPKNIKNTCKTNIYKFRANSKKAQQVNPSPFKSAQVPWTYFFQVRIWSFYIQFKFNSSNFSCYVLTSKYTDILPYCDIRWYHFSNWVGFSQNLCCVLLVVFSGSDMRFCSCYGRDVGEWRNMPVDRRQSHNSWGSSRYTVVDVLLWHVWLFWPICLQSKLFAVFRMSISRNT